MLIHGFACDHTDWNAQVEALREHHRVVTCDLRGHGSTPGKPQDCSIETYGADVAELVEALQLTPAVLVGHSMGCRVALEVACQRPWGVAGLVLVDGSVTGSGDPEAAELASRDPIAAKGFRTFSKNFFRGMFLVPFNCSSEIIERAGKLPVEIGSSLLPRISRARGCASAAAGDPKHVYGSNAKARVALRRAKLPVARLPSRIRAERPYRGNPLAIRPLA